MTKTFLMLFLLVFSMQSLGENLRTEEVVFVSHGATLSGSIVFPAGEIHAAVVFIHGSGKQARNLRLAEQFAKGGIAALVYDKRGAGKSGGEYEGNQNVSEKNISLLADDALSAMRSLSTHPSLKGIALDSPASVRLAGSRHWPRNEATSRNSWCCGAARSAR